MGDLKDRFDNMYSRKKDLFHNGEPESTVQNILKYKENGSVLELASGQGRNALFLASHGFEVTAVDISTQGLANLKESAEKSGLDIKIEEVDIQDFNFQGNFDVLICTCFNSKCRK